MAIGGVVMLSSTKMVTNQVTAQRNIAAKASFNNSMFQLSQYLSYQNNCTSGLLPMNFSIVTDPSGMPLNLNSISQIPYSGNPVLATGAVSPEFEISSIALEFNPNQPNVSAPHSYLASLVIRGMKKGKVTGPTALYHAIPMYLQLSAAVAQKRTFQNCAFTNNATSSSAPVVNTDCPAGKFYQSALVGCVPPVELLTADPATPFTGEVWLRTDL